LLRSAPTDVRKAVSVGKALHERLDVMAVTRGHEDRFVRERRKTAGDDTVDHG
jgi:hypothetical protein